MVNFWQTKPMRHLLLGLFSGLCAFLFAACSQSTSPLFNQSSNQASSAGAAGSLPTPVVLKIAVAPDFAPFEFKTPEGKLAGFDIDLMNAVGDTAGFLIQYAEMPFEDIIRDLHASNVNAAISAITITPERAQVVSFSRPYFRSGLVIAVSNSPTISDLSRLGGKRIGAQSGTTGETKARSIANAHVVSFDSTTEALQRLKQGQLDAVISDAPAITYALKTSSLQGLKIVGSPITEEFYGIAVPKRNNLSPDLYGINAGLFNVISSGKYAEIYQKWFGTAPAQLPATAPGVS